MSTILIQMKKIFSIKKNVIKNSTRGNVAWHPPLAGLVKLNVDAALIPSDLVLLGFGVVVRDDEGMVLAAVCWYAVAWKMQAWRKLGLWFMVFVSL